MVHCIYLGVTGYILRKKTYCIFSLKIDMSEQAADPDEMQPYAAFIKGFTF